MILSISVIVIFNYNYSIVFYNVSKLKPIELSILLEISSSQRLQYQVA